MYICATTMWLGMCGSGIGGSCGLLKLFPNEYLAFTLQRQCLPLECGGFHGIAMASYSAALECGLTRYSHKYVNTLFCLGQFFTNDSSTFADFFSEFVSSCVTLGYDSRFPSVLLPHKHEHHLAFS